MQRGPDRWPLRERGTHHETGTFRRRHHPGARRLGRRPGPYGWHGHGRHQPPGAPPHCRPPHCRPPHCRPPHCRPPHSVHPRTAVHRTAVRRTAVHRTAVRHIAVRAARAARHAWDAPPVVFDCSRGQVRPRSFILTCVDRNNYLTRLSWSAWSSAFASGSGTQTINSCLPTCTAGQFHSYPVDFVLWRTASVPDHSGKRYFSRVTVLYPGARPPAYRHARPQTGPETWTGTIGR